MRKNDIVLAVASLVVAACSDASTPTHDPVGTTGQPSLTNTGTTSAPTTTSAASTGPTSTSAATTATSTTTGTSAGSVTTTTGTTAATTTGSGGATSSGTTTSGTGDTTVTSTGGGMGGTGGTAPGICPYTPPEDPDAGTANWASGEVTLFNDDGAWTWYSDERVVVDAEGGKLIVTSDANAGNRNGNVDIVIHDLATGENARTVLGDLDPDDHNNGAILVKAPGEYLVLWAGHNQNCNTYWNNYTAGKWGMTAGVFNWSNHSAPCPWSDPPRSVTYNNVWNMSSENKIYNFTRTVDTSPNLLVSDDNGQSWEYGGRLSSTPQVGYVAGYYKYWGNGVDRVDFLATNAHPRDNDNSLFHGYVKGGKIYNSFDEVVDDNLGDATAKEITDYTTVYQTGTQTNGLTLNFLWNMDVVRYEDGTIGALWKARNNGVQGQDSPDHRMLYSRFDGTSWKATYLGKAGLKLYDSEQDYIGLGALDPDDPHVIYISTPYDPRDDTTDLGQHEIWKGVTCDDGASFTWTPVTANSTKDNLRPVMPKWDGTNKALLWFRGSYNSAQSYTEEVVGIISQSASAPLNRIESRY